MPGVKPEDLDIDHRENILTLTGGSSQAKGTDEEAVLAEYETGKYYLIQNSMFDVHGFLAASHSFDVDYSPSRSRHQTTR